MSTERGSVMATLPFGGFNTRGSSEGCSMCGLNWAPRDASLLDPVPPQAHWCKDLDACGERWLIKYVSGRNLMVTSIVLLGHGPAKQPVFELFYTVECDEQIRKRVVMPELHAGMDLHRRTEHYHLLEFGKDITNMFLP